MDMAPALRCGLEVVLGKVGRHGACYVVPSALNWVTSPIVSNTDKATDETVIVSDRVWDLSDTV